MIVRLIGAVVHTIVVWYTLKNNSTTYAVSFINSFLSRLIEVCLLVTIFLLGCGWQINHQIMTVLFYLECDSVEERDSIRYLHVCGIADFDICFILL